jgi:peptidoglycan/xylan/chitin deacetylase (PgdA/CDA1 family)
MLTFRRLTFLFFLFLLAMNLYSIFGCGTTENFICANLPWLYLGLIMSYFAVSITFAFLPCTGFHYPVLCFGDNKENAVAITFDDGPDGTNTARILDVLNKHEVPAAFFLIGKNVAGNEGLIRRICTEGHLAGTHSWSHSHWFDFFTPEMMRSELVRTAEAVKAVNGKSPMMFRPPYGVINPMLARALRDLPWNVIGWSIRSFDTMKTAPDSILQRILKKMHPGAIILLHDHSAFSRSHLESMILAIRKQGYSIVPLDQLLKIETYAE